MKIKAYLDGNKVQGVLPDSYKDLTVKQYIAISDNSSSIEMLANITGIDLWWFENTTLNLDRYMNHLNKVIKAIPDPSTADRVTGFKIMDRYITPKDINDLSWLQKDMIKAL